MFDPEIWLSLVVLTGLEVVLGIDNLVFLAVLTARLPDGQRPTAEKAGLALAVAARLVLLALMLWLTHLVRPVFVVFGHTVSWRDIVLVGGGLFLLGKATQELHGALEGEGAEAEAEGGGPARDLWVVIGQMAVLDAAFSFDSIVTAVGLTTHLWVMGAAVIAAMGVMVLAAPPISLFLDRHPAVKILTLSFLIMVGMALVADGLGVAVPKAYLYFAMAFSGLTEFVNLVIRRRAPEGAGSRPPAP